MSTLVLPYRKGSESSKEIASRLGILQMKLEGSKLKNSSKHTILNWGNSTADLSGLDQVRVINPQAAVKRASHKLKFFETISASEETISIPRWTTEKDVAQSWIEGGTDVLARFILQGHSGAGIEIILHDEEDAQCPDAPLYVAYVKKRDEYRVHVVGGTVTDVQRKARRTSRPLDLVNWQIRNHDNGFVFVRERVDPPQAVLENSVKAVQALGLDFGAVDVIWNQNKGKAYIIEVNTACAVSGITLDRYERALTSLLAGETPEPWQVEEVSTLPYSGSASAWAGSPDRATRDLFASLRGLEVALDDGADTRSVNVEDTRPSDTSHDDPILVSGRSVEALNEMLRGDSLLASAFAGNTVGSPRPIEHLNEMLRAEWPIGPELQSPPAYQLNEEEEIINE
jgi:hypothetical protein